MEGRIGRWIPLAVVMIGMAMTFGLAGCESTKQTFGIEPAPSPVPRYYDFPDVLVPPEISHEPKGSVVYESGGAKYGVLLFSGRVDVESLVEFFRKSMVKDGWALASSVRFNRILLNFSKPDKTCQILIWDKTMSTEVEIHLNPIKP